MSSTSVRSKVVAIAIALILAVSAAALLSSCTAKSLAGTWKGEVTIKDDYGFQYDVPVTLVITKDETYNLSMEAQGRITGVTWKSLNEQGKCSISGTTVKLVANDGSGTTTFTYAASTNGKETLTANGGGVTLELTKVS